MSVLQSNPGQEQPGFAEQSSVTATPVADNTPSVPVRRGPGRPKGSGKKQHEFAQSDQPKMKRPVGRPRKDGLPAGSLSPPKPKRGPGRPRKSEMLEAKSTESRQTVTTALQPQAAASTSDDSAQATGTQPYIPPYKRRAWEQSAPPMASLQSGTYPQTTFTDPNDDWLTLLHNDPDLLLRELLASLTTLVSVRVTTQVEDAFKYHLATLAAKDKDHPDMPSLYTRLKSFWLPSSSSYFANTIGAGRVPSEQRFLYWDPLPLVSTGLPCPLCTEYLIHSGFIRTGPVKVYDLGRAFFVIGCEYQCRSRTCTSDGIPQKFASTDSRILQLLPEALRNDFPACLSRDAENSNSGAGLDVWNWQAMGVSTSLYKLIGGCLHVGLTKEPIVYLLGNVFDATQQQTQQHHQPEPQQHQQPQQAGPPEEARTSNTTTITPSTSTSWSNNSNVIDTSNTSQQSHGIIHGGSTSYPELQSNYYTPNPAPVPVVTNPTLSNISGPAYSSSHSHTSGASYPYQPYSYNHVYSTNMISSSSIPQNGSTSTYAPEVSSSKRGLAQFAEQHNINDGGTPAKRTRHCSKCGSKDCKGKGGRSLCGNPCQDCGRVSCQGRNSRYPNKRCQEAYP